jgi:hypothetical protein
MLQGYFDIKKNILYKERKLTLLFRILNKIYTRILLMEIHPTVTQV